MTRPIWAGTVSGMDHNQAIAELLQERKDEAGLTDEALALASATPKSTLQRYLANPGDAKVASLQRIAAALGTSLGDLDREAHARQSAAA